jgi:hypothetical protein
MNFEMFSYETYLTEKVSFQDFGLNLKVEFNYFQQNKIKILV